MKIKLPPTVRMILDSLHARGYEAYAVGGCVRDTILARTPDDWDITTSARPEEVKAIFHRTVDTGIAHGTVTVLAGDKAHEVTTYRVDGEYRDFRHPDGVTFTASLPEDLKRRDFTINAMAYNDEQGLVDLYGGMEDLQRKIIRCVGNPMDRFREDALRILRAVRFAAQLDFSIEPATADAIVALAPNLSRISEERICTELIKLLVSDHPECLRQAYQMGITKVILPEFDRMMETEQNNPNHFTSVGEHTLLVLDAVPKDKVIRLAALLHDVGKPAAKTTDRYGVNHFKKHPCVGADIAEKIMRRLRLDNDTIRKVKRLVYYHDWHMEPESPEVRRAISEVGPDLFPYLMQLQYGDVLGQSDFHKEEKLERIMAVWDLYKKIMEENQCVSVRQLAVNGRDLLRLGVSPGPEVGETLQELLDLVLEDQSRNTRECLEKFVKEKLK